MQNQHGWIKGSFGGLIKAPIDYEKKHQKILDSATADGKAYPLYTSSQNPMLTESRDLALRRAHPLASRDRVGGLRHCVSPRS